MRASGDWGSPGDDASAGPWWHCVQSWSPSRPFFKSTFSEKSCVVAAWATWQFVHVIAPALKQPESVRACVRLKRLGRPSGQNSPCASNSGSGSLSRNGSAWSSYRSPAANPVNTLRLLPWQ